VVTALQDDLRGRGLRDSGERSYVMSKTYMLMANTRELARRLEGTGVDVIAGETIYAVKLGLRHFTVPPKSFSSLEAGNQC